MFEIEDGIDFYSEININNNDDTNDNICLITQSALDEDSIQLKCGHSFNYGPLFYDILNHKQLFNKLEKKSLKVNEIRCPYCRNIEHQLLPCRPSFPKVHGVNFFDETIYLSNIQSKSSDLIWTKGICQHKDDYDGYPCLHNIVTHIELFNLDLCCTHKNEYIKNHIKKLLKDKKEKEKLEKKLLKEEENKLIPNCSSILKNGNICSCKSVKEGLCTRHYNLIYKPKNETQHTLKDLDP